MLGDNIRKTIQELEATGLHANQERKGDTTETFNFESELYHLEVTIDPTAWLGLNFTLELPEGRLDYSIDTDLYNLQDERNRAYAQEVEADICSFLKKFRLGKIKQGTINGRPAMILPVAEGVEVVVKGKYFTKTKFFKESNKAEDLGPFQSLKAQ